MQRPQKPGYNQKKMKMYESVARLLGRNNSITTTIPAFANSIEEFNQIIDRIKRTEKELSQNIKLEAEDIDSAKDNLISSLLPIASALYTFGRKNERKLIGFKERDLRNISNEELINKAAEVYNTAKDNFSRLKDYGITDDNLTRLQNKISNFEISTDAIKDNGDEKGLRAALYDYLHQADEMLEEDLDNFMELLREENPVLYNDYQSARLIKDMGIETPNNEMPNPLDKKNRYDNK